MLRFRLDDFQDDRCSRNFRTRASNGVTCTRGTGMHRVMGMYVGNIACSSELSSKFLKGGLCGDYIGDYYKGN